MLRHFFRAIVHNCQGSSVFQRLQVKPHVCERIATVITMRICLRRSGEHQQVRECSKQAACHTSIDNKRPGSLAFVSASTKRLTCDKLIVVDVVLHLTGAPSVRPLIAAQSASNIASIWLRQDGKSRGRAIMGTHISIATQARNGSLSVLLKEALDPEQHTTSLRASQISSPCSSRQFTLLPLCSWLKPPLMAQ